jgi:hypothetical protein
VVPAVLVLPSLQTLAIRPPWILHLATAWVLAQWLELQDLVPLHLPLVDLVLVAVTANILAVRQARMLFHLALALLQELIHP